MDIPLGFEARPISPDRCIPVEDGRRCAEMCRRCEDACRSLAETMRA